MNNAPTITDIQAMVKELEPERAWLFPDSDYAPFCATPVFTYVNIDGKGIGLKPKKVLEWRYIAGKRKQILVEKYDVVYVRVSTVGQAMDGYSIDDQIDRGVYLSPKVGHL
ncbi:MAG TPA: hypothetical protein VFB38_21380 [Chthonomonadaceae bacterium]|jgi:hypothetical protein|nr:hypothetical protein [Chthonomonadaceae bacterium]